MKQPDEERETMNGPRDARRASSRDRSRWAAIEAAGAGFPSRRATRWALLLLMPGAVLCAAGLPSWAQSLRRWADGDTLTAQALNAHFDALQSRIDALETDRASPLALSEDDARYDDVHWALLHAAAVGACGGTRGYRFSAAATLPKPAEQTCDDVCAPLELTCVGSVSVGGLLTERASSRRSVGGSFRYPCGDQPGDAAALPNTPTSAAPATAFDEVVLSAGEARERLGTGAAQYCCCASNALNDPTDIDTDNDTEPPRGDGDS